MVDNKKLEEFVLKAIGDLGSSLGSMMIILGDRLGLYKALSQFGPMTSEELAHNTGTAERYIREWLASQAAAGYLSYDPENKKFSLSTENAMVLADENSPVYLLGGYQILESIFKDEDKFVKIFQTGDGLRWGDHHHDLYEGTAKFFRPNYTSNLVQSWIPSLEGIEQILKEGGKVADIGCGYGISTTIMEGVVIGQGVVVGQGVVIGQGVVVGLHSAGVTGIEVIDRTGTQPGAVVTAAGNDTDRTKPTPQTLVFQEPHPFCLRGNVRLSSVAVA
jgi:hypothetical protein